MNHEGIPPTIDYPNDTKNYEIQRVGRNIFGRIFGKAQVFVLNVREYIASSL